MAEINKVHCEGAACRSRIAGRPNPHPDALLLLHPLITLRQLASFRTANEDLDTNPASPSAIFQRLADNLQVSHGSHSKLLF